MGRNSGLTDQFFLDDNKSIFLPRGYGKISNFYYDWKDCTFTGNIQGPGTGNMTRIDQQRQGDAAGETQLWITISALSTASGSPTYKRFVDYLGYAMIKEILVQYQTYVIQRIPGSLMHARDQMLFRELRDRAMVGQNVAGDLSIGQRNTYATVSGNILKIDLPLHWSPELYNRMDRMLLFIGLPHPVEYYITLTDVAAVCQYDTGTVTWSVTDMKLRTKWFFFTEKERQQLTSKLQSSGISYKVLYTIVFICYFMYVLVELVQRKIAFHSIAHRARRDAITNDVTFIAIHPIYTIAFVTLSGFATVVAGG